MPVGMLCGWRSGRELVGMPRHDLAGQGSAGRRRRGASRGGRTVRSSKRESCRWGEDGVPIRADGER